MVCFCNNTRKDPIDPIERFKENLEFEIHFMKIWGEWERHEKLLKKFE